ncbi:hypothetical protein Fcan01_16939 [Folsomia candida]|uniref:Uncharacterized protein n=1 Tax=Folsomia candida TaxID=158441 RepID=A0A226DT55_FOLCA|nr:hypothetical protein Fcan01_16939 [Folsomia candida]
MYSKRFLLANHVFKNVSALLGANPILFDIRTNKFYSTPYSRFSTRFNLILLIIQFIFGTFRLFTFGYLSKKTDHELFIFNATYIIILAMFIPQICLVILTFNCQDEVDCLNQALQYMSRIREKWITLTEREFLSSYPTGYLLEYFHYVVAITVAGYWFFGCVAIYLIEILPFHWISLIPVQLRSRAVLWAHLAFYGHEILISSISVGIALQIVSSYIGFIPFQTLVIQLSLFCNWMLLAHWDGLGFSRYIMLIGGFTLVSFWAVVLQTCGKFYAKNKESWRLVEDKYFRKWRKSVTPLYFGHPGYYVIKRLSILKFCKTIIRGTFRMMVTLKNV